MLPQKQRACTFSLFALIILRYIKTKLTAVFYWIVNVKDFDNFFRGHCSVKKFNVFLIFLYYFLFMLKISLRLVSIRWKSFISNRTWWNTTHVLRLAVSVLIFKTVSVKNVRLTCAKICCRWHLFNKDVSLPVIFDSVHWTTVVPYGFSISVAVRIFSFFPTRLLGVGFSRSISPPPSSSSSSSSSQWHQQKLIITGCCEDRCCSCCSVIGCHDYAMADLGCYFLFRWGIGDWGWLNKIGAKT